MDKYKITIKYGTDDINNIFIKVLKVELKNYIDMICNKDKEELTCRSTYLSLKEGGNNNLYRE